MTGTGGEYTTVLLGAGASAKVLPVQSRIVDRIGSLRDTLSGMPPLCDSSFFLSELERLIGIHDEYGSFDHYARPVSGVDPGALRRDTLLYSTVWLLMQSFSEIGTDCRYNDLLEHILNPENQIRSDFTLISWNYDIQLERAYLQRTGRRIADIDLAAHSLGTKPWTNVETGRINSESYPGRFLK